MPTVAARSATALCGQPLTLKKASIVPSFRLSATCWARKYSALRSFSLMPKADRISRASTSVPEPGSSSDTLAAAQVGAPT